MNTVFLPLGLDDFTISRFHDFIFLFLRPRALLCLGPNQGSVPIFIWCLRSDAQPDGATVCALPLEPFPGNSNLATGTNDADEWYNTSQYYIQDMKDLIGHYTNLTNQAGEPTKVFAVTVL